ncbi:sce7726 family protein [Idiomarina loihiensis]|uniref:sce7726 family protein n=1 Tax=Idiomarina loihiensis TaxID=135577 RepID=UPI003158DFFE
MVGKMLLRNQDVVTPEQKIKICVIEHMRSKELITPDDTVLSEFTVDGYSRRADLVLIKKSGLVAIEIKSESDSLSRLKGQTEKYLDFFDKVIVVTVGKHLKNAAKQLPLNVALWECNTDSVRVIQRGRKKAITDKVNLLRHLRSRELSVIATKYGYKSTRRDRKSLELFLLGQSVKTLRHELILCMKKRYLLISKNFWSSVNGAPITASVLERLSFSGSAKVSRRKDELAVFLSNLNFAAESMSEERCEP